MVAATTVYLSSFGCGGEKNTPTEPKEEEVIEQSYINFHAYWSEGDNALVNVSLYESSKNTRLLFGGTLPNGNFYSLNRYTTNKKYEIFIHDIKTGQCLDNVIVNFNANPPWPISEREEIEKELNVGPNNPMRDLPGCRP